MVLEPSDNRHSLAVQHRSPGKSSRRNFSTPGATRRGLASSFPPIEQLDAAQPPQPVLPKIRENARFPKPEKRSHLNRLHVRARPAPGRRGCRELRHRRGDLRILVGGTVAAVLAVVVGLLAFGGGGASLADADQRMQGVSMRAQLTMELEGAPTSSACMDFPEQTHITIVDDSWSTGRAIEAALPKISAGSTTPRADCRRLRRDVLRRLPRVPRGLHRHAEARAKRSSTANASRAPPAPQPTSSSPRPQDYSLETETMERAPHRCSARDGSVGVLSADSRARGRTAGRVRRLHRQYVRFARCDDCGVGTDGTCRHGRGPVRCRNRAHRLRPCLHRSPLVGSRAGHRRARCRSSTRCSAHGSRTDATASSLPRSDEQRISGGEIADAGNDPKR